MRLVPAGALFEMGESCSFAGGVGAIWPMARGSYWDAYRIGLNTGQAVIGNMGSEVRFNYTMMGDSVNLAARCESGAKVYGVYTMVTSNTLQEALAQGCELNYRMLDRIVVKGHSEPMWKFTNYGMPAQTLPLRQSARNYTKRVWSTTLPAAGKRLSMASESEEFEPGLTLPRRHRQEFWRIVVRATLPRAARRIGPALTV